jgi:hypothetical protein
VELQTAALVGRITETRLVTYRERGPQHPHLDDLLHSEPRPGGGLWIASWGGDVPELMERLHGRPRAYHAHSCGYGFRLPPGVPVLAVSRNSLGYWGDAAPRNPLFLVPNALERQWLERGDRAGDPRSRPIDVLVQRRKCSRYVLRELVPALRAGGLRVEVQSGWVEDLVALFNQARVVLYDSAEYWRSWGVSEGFGLPPLEAMACGCVVFSSLNHALADSLDPGLVGHQIGCGSREVDLHRIVAAVRDPRAWRPTPERLQALLGRHDEAALLERWRAALAAIAELEAIGGVPLRAVPRWRSRWQLRRRRAATLLGRLRARRPGATAAAGP